MEQDQYKKISSVPEDIVKLLVDQLKESSLDNTRETKNLTSAINELIRTITSFPTNKEMLDEFRKHDDCSVKRSKEEIDTIYNICDKCINTTKEVDIEIQRNIEKYEKNLDDKLDDKLDEKLLPFSTCLNKLSNKIRTMIIIVLVTFSLIISSYLFVRSSVEHNIDKYIDKIKIECSQENQKK